MGAPTAQEEVQMMLNPTRWPLGAVLPLKNLKRRGSDGMPQMGVLYAGDIAFTIYHTDMYQFKATERKTYPFEVYARPMKAVEDGWVVD